MRGRVGSDRKQLQAYCKSTIQQAHFPTQLSAFGQKESRCLAQRKMYRKTFLRTTNVTHGKLGNTHLPNLFQMS